MKGLTSLALAVHLLLTDAVVHAQATEIVVDPSPGGSPRTRGCTYQKYRILHKHDGSIRHLEAGEFTCPRDGVMFLSFFFSIWLVLTTLASIRRGGANH